MKRAAPGSDSSKEAPAANVSDATGEAYSDDATFAQPSRVEGKPEAKIVAKPLKAQIPMEEMRKIVGVALKLRNVSFLSETDVRKEYAKLLKTSEEVKCLQEKKRRARKEIRKLEASITRIETKLASMQLGFDAKEEDPKEAAIKRIYDKMKGECFAYMESKEGGTYAHIQYTSLRTLLDYLREHCSFDRSSTFLDVGAGLNIPCHHAAMMYCGWAVGIELDEHRCLRAAEFLLSHWEAYDDEIRNPRIALIKANVLHCLPPDYATHIFLFDLVFAPLLYFQVLHWLAKARTWKYIVTFKPAREPSYQQWVEAILGVEPVEKLRGLKYARSSTSCIIYQRTTAVAMDLDGDNGEPRDGEPRDGEADDGIPPLPPPSIDSWKLAQAFFSGDIEKTKDSYRSIVKACQAQIDMEQRPRTSTELAQDSCLCDAWTQCEGACDACDVNFTPLPRKVLKKLASSVAGSGLFTTISLKEEVVLLQYRGREYRHEAEYIAAGLVADEYVLRLGKKWIDARGRGIHSFVNHSCDPNARLQSAVDRNGDDVCFIVTDKPITVEDKPVEVKVDYGNDHLGRIQCNCQSPYCRQRPKVLLLGMVQFSMAYVQKHLEGGERRDRNTLNELVECAKGKRLSIQHLRDTARCCMTEATCGVNVFTVDKNQVEGTDPDRHFAAPFDSSRGILFSVLAQCRRPIKFDEIILDYFWIPRGWAEDHWNDGFFSRTVPQFALKDVLVVGGSIILPCVPRVLNGVAQFENGFRDLYDISFIYKDDLESVSLWKGTRGIDGTTMQEIFEKGIHQEDVYCVVTHTELQELQYASRRFEDSVNIENARFLRLRRRQ